MNAAAKKTAGKKSKEEFKIIKKKSGRFAVKAKSGKMINGLEKTKILLSKNLIKTGLPKAPEENAGEAAPAAT